MDSYELNKIFGAVLVALLGLMGIGMFSDALFSKHKLEKAAYALPEAAEGGAAAPGAAAAPQINLVELLEKADASRGAAYSKQQCGACHTFDKGGKSGTGPNLYGVVGRPIAGVAGFTYSPALQAKGKEAGNWSFENLQAFISNPRGFAAGNKMAYGGVKDPTRLGEVLAYLRAQADTPAPLPTAAK